MKLGVFTILLVSTTASLHGVLGTQCGAQAGGALCPNGLCCSSTGYCGTTPAFCSHGCQSQCIPPPQCGFQAGGARCPNSLCCSRWGYCGTTGPFCDEGCQSQCSHPPMCGSQAGGARCPHGLCCSRLGYCGNTQAYCRGGCQSYCTNPPQCGIQAGGALCPNGLCCSATGFCGITPAFCGVGCQSQCSHRRSMQPIPSLLPISLPSPGADGVASIISSALFDELLKHRNNTACPARGFYRYEDFIAAADAFVGFGTTGDLDTRKREIAAFFAQTSHQTTGARPSPEDGPYAWGYCFLEEVGATADYCVPSMQWPCAPGKKFFGRGPIQISYNYNYGAAGKAIGVDLLSNPELVATDPTISFKTAIWFWMTPQSLEPSCHDVITGRWTPNGTDLGAHRLPGYGVITNIVSGRIECGRGFESRIGFYKRYCDILGVDYGDNLDCYNQKPFNSGRAVE